MGITAANPDQSNSLGHCEVRVDLTLYSERTVFRASHEFTGKCFVDVSRAGPDVLVVGFTEQQVGTDLSQVEREFANALLDHHVREEIERTTEPIRRLIVTQAFGEADFTDGPHSHSAANAEPKV